MGQLFAADFPERVHSHFINTFVSPRYQPRIPEFIREGDPPILNGPQIYEHFMRVLETWGVDASYLVGWGMPSQTENTSFIRWMARLLRFAASPKDFKRQFDSIYGLDAGDAPERISCRTLVMHSHGDQGKLHVAMTPPRRADSRREVSRD